ncbi:hypothetical protein [Luteolibacter yonseiensis]
MIRETTKRVFVGLLVCCIGGWFKSFYGGWAAASLSHSDRGSASRRLRRG